ncbi:MAG: molecular chaperone [Acidobacteria bacterium]|nr:molecular chaperone [Acidobacteriota bacterium]
MRPLLLFLFSLATGTAFAAGGAGDLLVSPTRVVLDRQTHTAELTLMNTGTAPATYRVDVTHVRMTESGAFVASDEPADAFADAYVQFSPRRVVLQPRVVQTVRVRMRPPATPVAGELYLHLLFHGEPPIPRAAAEPNGKSMSVSVTPIYGVAVPVIVRLEDIPAPTVQIADVRLAKADAVAFQLVRDGNCSTYGNITVTFTPSGGEAQEVAVLRGLSIYAPLPRRSVTLPLRTPLRDGTLQVSYVDSERNGSQRAVATLAVP